MFFINIMAAKECSEGAAFLIFESISSTLIFFFTESSSCCIVFIFIYIFSSNAVLASFNPLNRV